MPTVLGTYTYYNEDKGWGARGGKPQQAGVFYRVGDTAAKANAIKPNEYVAFQRPGRERELPLGLTRKVKDAFREAERAVDNNMPISGAAAIRTTIRLIIESEGLNSSDLDSGIKALNLKPEFMRALGNLKLVGDHSLHYEEYKIEELANALEVLHLSIDELFAARQRLALLEKAVGNKASNQGKSKGA